MRRGRSKPACRFSSVVHHSSRQPLFCPVCSVSTGVTVRQYRTTRLYCVESAKCCDGECPNK